MEFVDVIAQIIGSPLYTLVILLGISISLLHLRSHGTAAKLSLIAFGLMLVQKIAYPISYQMLNASRVKNDWDYEKFGSMLQIYGTFTSLFSTIGIALLLFAIFRRPPAETAAASTQQLPLSSLLFSFRGTISRIQLLALFIPIFLVGLPSSFLIEFNTVTKIMFALPFILMTNYILWSAYIRRFRDLGHSPWLCLILLVPFVNLIALGYLLIWPSKPAQQSETVSAPFAPPPSS